MYFPIKLLSLESDKRCGLGDHVYSFRLNLVHQNLFDFPKCMKFWRVIFFIHNLKLFDLKGWFLLFANWRSMFPLPGDLTPVL